MNLPLDEITKAVSGALQGQGSAGIVVAARSSRQLREGAGAPRGRGVDRDYVIRQG